jgi:hypothetical protein
MDVCGADINVTHVRMATEHLDTWEKLIGSRKSPLQQARHIGFGTLFKLFTRQLTLEEAVERVSRSIRIKGRAIVWDHAEPCMDVDKPHQLELLRADLTKSQRRSSAKARLAAEQTRRAGKKPGAGKRSPLRANLKKGVAPRRR